MPRWPARAWICCSFSPPDGKSSALTHRRIPAADNCICSEIVAAGFHILSCRCIYLHMSVAPGFRATDTSWPCCIRVHQEQIRDGHVWNTIGLRHRTFRFVHIFHRNALQNRKDTTHTALLPPDIRRCKESFIRTFRRRHDRFCGKSRWRCSLSANAMRTYPERRMKRSINHLLVCPDGRTAAFCSEPETGNQCRRWPGSAMPPYVKAISPALVLSA